MQMVGESLISGGGVELVSDTGLISPLVIIALCVIAGIGTVLLLPAMPRRKASMRGFGGLLLTVATLLLAVLLVTYEGEPQHDANGVFFWIFSAIAVGSAIRVVTHPRPVYSALYFVLTVFASGGLFVLLAADFLAAALILIYAGAILITYVFVIMLAAQATAGPAGGSLAGLADYDLSSREPFVATCVGFALMGLLIFLIFNKADGLVEPQQLMESPAGQFAPDGPTQALGEYLFRHQLVNVELAGLILTLSMVGAIVIARRKVGDPSALPSMAMEEVLGPATPINDDPHSIPVFGTRDPEQKAYPET
jgi:NADH-quinone oxidoreductase subunit J